MNSLGHSLGGNEIIPHLIVWNSDFGSLKPCHQTALNRPPNY